MRIHLLGFMAAGKSSLGPAIARRGGLPFLDLDQEVERRSGLTVPDLFALVGERAFREEEHAALRALEGRRDLVLATGGGAVEDPSNRALLGAGFCVYLDWEWPLLAARILARPASRPLAAGGETALRERWERRVPLYRGLARLVLPLGSREAEMDRRRLREQLSRRILAAARAAEGEEAPPCA
ncbi:MAG: shikimate kinase [Candidatus Krumholzibacteriia bacterium]|nr:shikimate kinase [Candidatus Latescibacterota bacterium]